MDGLTRIMLAFENSHGPVSFGAGGVHCAICDAANSGDEVVHAGGCIWNVLTQEYARWHTADFEPPEGEAV